MSRFYTFDQNNSGGGFDYDVDRGITHFVIVEAEDADDATVRAERIGLYFDGAGDCPCCGNRWYAPWRSDGTDEPLVYDRPPAEYFNDPFAFRWMPEGREVAIHYLDGHIEWPLLTTTEKAA